ncbi:DUF3263 domain-containing protein [Streptomyces microflavus]|uniref:DUF3263 domain-containing protein n=1 Tax=Streptomyces cyaneofuscatus TaxID=66883 RepID=UPI003CFA29BE
MPDATNVPGEDEQDPQQLPIGRPLTEQERSVLEAAQATASMQPGPRERYVREELGLSPTRYFQLLNALLDLPAARQANPTLIRILSSRRQSNREKYW